MAPHAAEATRRRWRAPPDARPDAHRLLGEAAITPVVEQQRIAIGELESDDFADVDDVVTRFVGRLEPAIQACDGSGEPRCAGLSGFAVETRKPAILCFIAREALSRAAPDREPGCSPQKNHLPR